MGQLPQVWTEIPYAACYLQLRPIRFLPRARVLLGHDSVRATRVVALILVLVISGHPKSFNNTTRSQPSGLVSLTISSLATFPKHTADNQEHPGSHRIKGLLGQQETPAGDRRQDKETPEQGTSTERIHITSITHLSLVYINNYLTLRSRHRGGRWPLVPRSCSLTFIYLSARGGCRSTPAPNSRCSRRWWGRWSCCCCCCSLVSHAHCTRGVVCNGEVGSLYCCTCTRAGRLGRARGSSTRRLGPLHSSAPFAGPRAALGRCGSRCCAGSFAEEQPTRALCGRVCACMRAVVQAPPRARYVPETVSWRFGGCFCANSRWKIRESRGVLSFCRGFCNGDCWLGIFFF